MARRKWVWDANAPDPWGGKGAMVEVDLSYQQPTDLHYVRGDTPGYVSPVTGLYIDGAKARRDDLARTDSRPYEGFEQETKEAQRRARYAEERTDRKIDEAARRAYYQLDPKKRRHLD